LVTLAVWIACGNVVWSMNFFARGARSSRATLDLPRRSADAAERMSSAVAPGNRRTVSSPDWLSRPAPSPRALQPSPAADLCDVGTPLIAVGAQATPNR
jgi:hypothetical protein